MLHNIIGDNDQQQRPTMDDVGPSSRVLEQNMANTTTMSEIVMQDVRMEEGCSQLC